MYMQRIQVLFDAQPNRAQPCRLLTFGRGNPLEFDWVLLKSNCRCLCNGQTKLFQFFFAPVDFLADFCDEVTGTHELSALSTQTRTSMFH